MLELGWFVCLIFNFFLHSGIIRSQTNLNVHDVKVCKDIPDQWGNDPRCPEPVFKDGSAAVSVSKIKKTIIPRTLSLGMNLLNFI